MLLRQAFSNLLRNSVEACALAAHRARDRRQRRRGRRRDTRDRRRQRPGIVRERLARLFQPFFTTKTTGTGLGLAIVQKVIVSHNGRITAGNRSDGGAQIRIRLPQSATS